MIKRFFLNIINKFYTRRSHTKHYSVPFEKASTIGILIDNPDNEMIDVVNNFIRKLAANRKEVEIICRIEKSYLRNYDFNYLPVSKKSIDWKGKYKDERINNFIKKEFDYLYCINNSPFLLFQNILIRSKAKFRIGIINKFEIHNFELGIQPKEHERLDSILEKLLSYSKKIN